MLAPNQFNRELLGGDTETRRRRAHVPDAKTLTSGVEISGVEGVSESHRSQAPIGGGAAERSFKIEIKVGLSIGGGGQQERQRAKERAHRSTPLNVISRWENLFALS